MKWRRRKMNQLNYGTLEACQRLHEAGIGIKTENVWFFSTTGWELVDRYIQHPVNKHYLPAPSMAEVWRELPCYHNSGVFGNLPLIMCKSDQGTAVGYGEMLLMQTVNTNPTDALIDLLIWVRKRERSKP
jgi:hypothetical protein